MEIIKQSNNRTGQMCAKHLRLKSRIVESAKQSNLTQCTMLYTTKAQVRIMGIWVTVWAETCDYSDGDTRPYIKNCATEVLEAITAKI